MILSVPTPQPDPASMPDATRLLFERLSQIDALSSFILIGGTALAINEMHRLSEDLDFCSTSKKLNGQIMRQIVDALTEQGCDISLQENLEARHDFEDAGLEIDDHHRDYAVDGVKLSFFVTEHEDSCAMEGANPTTYGSIRVADTKTLFRIKSVLLSKRITQRDLFDLHYLLFHKGFTVDELIATVNQCHPTYAYEAIRSRLLTSAFRSSDPGYLALVDNDISVQQLREDIHQLIAGYERELTQTRLEEELINPSH